MADKARIDFEANDKTGSAFAAVSGKLEGVAKSTASLVARFTAVTAALGLAAAGFTKLDGSARAVAEFQGLSEATGASAENISALDQIARRTGTTYDTLASSLVRFNAVLNADPKSKQADALERIGLSTKELRQLDPAEALLRVSQALEGYADDGEKARLVQELFGKSTKDVSGFLRDLAEEGKLTAASTREQIEQSDKYVKNLARLSATAEDASRVLSGRFAIAVNGLIDDFKAATTEGTSFLDLLQFFAEKTSVSGILAGQFRRSLTLDKSASESVEFYRERIDTLDKVLAGTNLTEERRNRLLAQRATLLEQVAAAEANAVPDDGSFDRLEARRLQRTVKPPSGGGDDKDDPSARLFQNRMAALERAAAAEREILGSRNRVLDSLNQQGLLSFEDYYAGRKNAADLALRAELGNIDQQLAALRKFQAEAGKQTEKADAQGKIDALLADRNKVERAATEEAQALEAQRRESAEDYARVLRLLNADVVELKGNLVEAAGVRFDDQNAELVRRLTAEGNTEALRNLEIKRQSVVTQAELSKLDTEAARIQEALRNEEERIALNRQLGAITELDALAQVGAARAKSVQEMEAIALAQETVAKASGNPALVLAAQRARLELESLRLTADPLADKLNTLFKDAAGDGLADFISGTKTAKEAFTDFANSISQQLSRLAAQSIAESIFKGGSGGTGGLLGGLFSGGGGSSNNPSAANYENQLDRQSSGAGSGSGGGGWGSIVGSIIGGLFGLASGGNVQAGQIREVNERDGPGELLHAGGRTYLMAAQNAMVTPPMGGGGAAPRPIQVVQNFTLSQPADRRTQQQVAAEAYQGLVRANARNS